MDGDLIEIVPAEPYTSEDLNYGNQESRVVKEHNDQTILPEITGNIDNFQQYDIIFLGYPLWWGQAPNIIRSLLKKYDFNSKRIITFCTSISTSADSSQEILLPLASKAKWDSTWKRFSSSASERAVYEWTESLNFEKSILVIYFSAQGHTKRIAGIIQKTKNADIKEIEPVNPYTENDLNWHDESSRVWEEHRNPDLRPEFKDVGNLDQYNYIILGYPLWWRKAPHVVYTFIEKYDFSGKTIIPFCSSTSDGIGDSGADLESKSQTGRWLSGQRFSENPIESTVAEWVQSIDFSDSDSDVDPDIDPETPENKIQIIYFSATGNTRRVAQSIHTLLSISRIVEITPQNPYTSDDLNYNRADSRVSLEHQDQSLRPAINQIEKVEEAEIIFLGYPLWWQQAPHVVYTFIEQYNFTGKTIIPFSTSSSSPMGTSGENLAARATSAKWYQGQRFPSGSSESTVKQWIDASIEINPETGKITVLDKSIDLDNGLSSVQIAGITIGCVLAIAAIGLIIFFVIRHKKRQNRNQELNDSSREQ